MTGRALARELGVTEGAIRKAKLRGRIIPEPDGSWDAAKVRVQLAQNTNVAQLRRRANGKHVPAAASEPATGAGEGNRTLYELQVQEKAIKVARDQARLAKEQGELIDKAGVVAAQIREAQAEKEALLNWPARIAADLAAQFQMGENTLRSALDRLVRQFLVERSSPSTPGSINA